MKREYFESLMTALDLLYKSKEAQGKFNELEEIINELEILLNNVKKTTL